MRRHRLDALRRSFWFLPAAAMAGGLVIGFVLVEADHALEIDPGVFTFVDLQSARAVLQTIATVTVSVAGLAFSVTVVALQLASQQLSPRVLRIFEHDRLAQVVLAAFLGTFVFALVVLAKLSARGVPALSLTVAMLSAVGAFALFVAFVHHIVVTLKASAIIRRIAEDGAVAIDAGWPAGVGSPARDREGAFARVAGRRRLPAILVRASRAGFLTAVDGESLVALARREDLLIRQHAALGEFVLTGTVLADASGHADVDEVDSAVRHAFTLQEERSAVTDVGFPVRQLVDVALRALSPALNDPTTAENALDVTTDLLIRFALAPEQEPIRLDETGEPRLVVRTAEFDDLVELAFEQLVIAAADHPVFARHLAGRLDELGVVARDAGRSEVALHALSAAMRERREAARAPDCPAADIR